MKKHLLFVITILVTGHGIHAQNTFPATGKVGIGTTSPLTLFQVKGIGSFGNRVTSANATRALNLADTAGVMRILRVHATNAPAIELLSRTSADGANIAYWDMYAEPSDKSFRIRDRVTGSNLDRLSITKNGDVGIGTTTPAGKLEVHNGSLNITNTTTSANLIINAKSSNASASNEILFQDNGATKWALGGSNIGSAGANNVSLYNYAVGANALTVLTSNSNVGIGTITPGDKLSIKGGAISFHHTSNDVPYVGIDYDTESDAMRFRANLYSTLLNTTYFTMQRSTGNIGIGTTSPFYPLDVTSATAVNVIHATSTYSGNSDKVALYASSVNAPGYGVGVEATGGYTGVHGSAQGGSPAGAATGVSGEASGGKYTYGVFGAAYDGSEINAAGYFNGNVYANGVLLTSDRKFKKDITPVENALAQIMKLRPSTYQFKTEEYKGMALPGGRQMGLIADELKQVFPELVQKAAKPARYDEKDRTKVIDPEVEYEAVNYEGLIPVLVASVQELNKKNDALVSENSDLKERLARIEAMLTKNNGALSLSSAYLETPVPNPSRSSALVRYGLPQGMATAKLTLVNQKGQVLKELTINAGGAGQVNVNTANLPAGAYTCSLWIDGQQAASTQLVIAR